MSQSNDAQDQEYPDNSKDSHHKTSSGSSSSTSSDGSCSAAGSSSTTTFSSVSNSSSKATMTGGSDLEDDSDHPGHRRQECYGSLDHSGNQGDISQSTNPPMKQNIAVELEEGPKPQLCDTTTIGSSNMAQSSSRTNTSAGKIQNTETKPQQNLNPARRGSQPRSHKYVGSSTSKTPHHLRSTQSEQPEQGMSRTASKGSSFLNLCPETNLDSCIKEGTPTTVDRAGLLRPTPSPSPSLSILDTNNNNKSASAAKEESSINRRNNFSKSASGSRLVKGSRPNVCDCLSQSCKEKEHSTRRQFIEHYYRSRTQLPSTNAISSINISTPLNRLSECDAITKRLLSSPRRGPSINENSCRRMQAAEVETRRASLGADTITEQLYLFSSSPFKSIETSYEQHQQQKQANKKATQQVTKNPVTTCDSQDIQPTTADDTKPGKQQQARSLSVCDDETRKPKLQNVRLNHSSNLNRAVSLACETGQPKRHLNIIPLFGCEVRSLEQFNRYGLVLPPVINSAVDHIIEHGINSVGIFRKSGVKSRILTLKQLIESNQDMRFDDINKENDYSIHDIADLVKMWFRELKPAPLMTKEFIKLITETFTQPTQIELQTRNDSLNRGTVSGQRTTSRHIQHGEGSLKNPKLVRLKARIGALTTPVQRGLFFRALAFLSTISSQSETNQMTSQNLAICLTPSLCATDPDQSSIISAQKALEFCIDNYEFLF